MAIPIAEATSEALAPLAAKTVAGIVTDGLIFEVSRRNVDGQGNAGDEQTTWKDLVGDISGTLDKDQVPDMTGSATPSGTASAQSFYSSYYPWKAFDDDPATYWTASGTSAWLQYQFATTARVIDKYTIQPAWSNGAPKDWVLSGSNNGSTFTTLDTRSGVIWSGAEVKTFTFSNSTAYTHYRLAVTATGSGTDWLSIAELQLIAAPTWDAEGLDLGGGGDHADFGDPSALELGSGPRTVSVWWKPDTVSAWHYIVKKRQFDPSYTGWAIRQNNTDDFQFVVQETIDAADYRTATSTTKASTGDWIHVTGVYDGNECYIYINGAENTASRGGSAGSHNTDNSVSLTIGKRVDNYFADGHVAQVLVYNRVLSAAEIKRNYEAGRDATSTSPQVAEATAQAFAPTTHDEAAGPPVAEATAEALVPLGATTSPAATAAEASAQAIAPVGAGSSVNAAVGEATAEAPAPSGIGAGIDSAVAEATAEAMAPTVKGGGLRRTYPAMVRTYPPLCRAA